MSSRSTIIALLGATLLLALIPLGRWEQNRSIRARLAGIEHVRAAIGPDLYNPDLTGYRIARPVDCLTYRAGSVIFARELCFDVEGRLIEAIDRRTGDPKIWSLREDPAAARLRLAPRSLDALIRRLGGLQGVPFTGLVPTAYESIGPSMRAILGIAEIIGPDLRTAPLTGYRLAAGAACLEFAPQRRYELCFDRAGYVVSAKDRSSGVAESAPAKDSPLRANPRVVRDLLRRAGAFPLARVTGVVPVGHG